jgi:hypothetical protein
MQYVFESSFRGLGCSAWLDETQGFQLLQFFRLLSSQPERERKGTCCHPFYLSYHDSAQNCTIFFLLEHWEYIFEEFIGKYHILKGLCHQFRTG